jgi:hypothetical protein
MIGSPLDYDTILPQRKIMSTAIAFFEMPLYVKCCLVLYDFKPTNTILRNDGFKTQLPCQVTDWVYRKNFCAFKISTN